MKSINKAEYKLQTGIYESHVVEFFSPYDSYQKVSLLTAFTS